MSLPSTSPTRKRLLHELKQYNEEPNDALIHLRPVSDEHILYWEAVMKGVKGSGYEGKVEKDYSVYQRGTDGEG